MTNLVAGQNIEIQFPLELTLTLERDTPYDIDSSLYLLADGKAGGDDDIIFFNQTASKDGKVNLAVNGRTSNKIVITGMPAGRDKIAITLASDSAANKLAGAGKISLSSNAFSAELTSDLAALIVAEVYERNGAYRLKLIGQGFDGGLAKLANHYGIQVADPAPAAATPAAPPPAAPLGSKISLRKDRVISLAKNDQKIIDLTKKAAISLEKKGMSNETAKFCLVLDISGSMHHLYISGAVDRLVQRVLAVGMTLDDDLSIDIFPFGINAHTYGSAGPTDYKNVVPGILHKHGLEGGTMYGRAIQLVRNHYRNEAGWGELPVYVMFVTDGNTMDPDITRQQMLDASREGIFWQFMAIGERKPKGFMSRAGADEGFAFLEALDDMPGRLIDNADFFSVASPDAPTDEQLYDLMINEYPGWLRAARQQGLIR